MTFYFRQIVGISFFVLMFTNSFCQVKSKDDFTNKNIIAKVGDRIITLNDFISRAEYTIRPAYCNGNYDFHKRIVLNTLIAEKLLALEAKKDNALLQNEKFQSFILGRKEQKMREFLAYNEGVKKVKLDSNEIRRTYSVAGRTYKIKYFNVLDKSVADSLSKELAKNDSTFDSFFNSMNLPDSLFSREVSWSSPENEEIYKALFSKKLLKNEVVGPLKVDDSTNLFIKVVGWNDRVVLTETDITNRRNDVIEKLTAMKGDSIYNDFIYEVMKNKKLDFDVDVFNKLAKILAPIYIKTKKDKEDEFLELVYKENPISNIEGSGSDINDIKNKPVLSIDGNVWTVDDLMKEIEKHPLVFREENARDKFAPQLRLAIVDLIRDKYLTDAAYKKSLGENEIVTHYEQSWQDASIALFQRKEYLKEVKPGESNAMQVIETHLNPYMEKLYKKCSDKIEINVEEFEKIQLTKIDMFTTQKNVPYPIYVPAFPQITTRNRLDYGKKMVTK